MKKMILEILIDKLGNKEIIQKISIRMPTPVSHVNKISPYIVQAIILIFFWTAYKEILAGLMNVFNIDNSKLCEVIEYVITLLGIVLLRGFISILYMYAIGEKCLYFPIAIIFFEYDAHYKKVFLKEKYKKVREILDIYFMLLLGAEAFVHILGWDNNFSVDRILVIYLVLLVRDIFHLYTCKEYEDELEKIPNNLRDEKIKNYIKEVKENNRYDFLIKDRVLCNQFPEIERKNVLEDEIDEFLYRNTKSLDHKVLMKTILEGKSVFTDTPFYQDIGLALFMPLHRALIQGKKIVFFIGGSEPIEVIKEWIEHGIKDVTGMNECWEIVSLAERDKMWDIGLITMEDLTMLYEMNRVIAEQAGIIVVFIHPERLLLDAQNELYEWGYLLSLKKIKPVYVVIERTTLGLSDLLSHIFRTEFIHVSKTATPSSITELYAVDAKRWDIFTKEINITSKTGVGSMLAAHANNANIQDIIWLAGDKKAFYDINSIIKQHIASIAKKTAQRGMVECKAGLWGVEREDSLFMIIEDDINHVLEMIRQSQTRGIYSSIISIVCERYLLLPFMLDNIDFFINDLYAFPAMAASYSDSLLNRTVILVKMLLYHGLTADELRKYRSRYQEKKYTGKSLHFEEKEEIIKEIKECFYVDVDLESIFNQQKQWIYRLEKKKELLDNIEKIISPAMYYDEEEKKQNFLGGKHLWQIDQLYLPEQIVALNGKLYKILKRETLSISGKWQEVLSVKRYREGIIYCPQYYQDRSYYKVSKIQEDYENERYGVKWGQSKVLFSVKTKGYYIAGSNGRNDKIEYRQVNEVEDRVYDNILQDRKNGIYIKLEEGMEWESRKMFAIILGEILKTLFPQGHQYIAVLPMPEDDNKPQNDRLGYLYYEIKKENLENSYQILILEDSILELGILSMINQHMEHILRIMYSYCSWWNEEGLSKGRDTVATFSLWKNAMPDTIPWISIMERCGIKKLSEYREKETLINRVNISTIQNKRIESKFCICCSKKITKESKICEQCSNSRLTQETYEELFRIVCWQLVILFGIEINVSVNIVLEETIHKGIVRMGNTFYCNPHAQIHSALANLVRELMIYWQLNNFTMARVLSKRRAIADWYELCFMNKYGYYEYVENRIQSIFQMERKEGKDFRKLYSQYSFDNYEIEAPLKGLI